MPFSPAPTVTQIEYHSSFAPHVMRLNNTEIDSVSGVASTFRLKNWVGGTVNWKDMVDALVAILADRYPTTVVFDRATLFTYADETAEPLFRGTIDLGAVAGTVTVPGTNEAVQETLTFRDTAGHLLKIVSLDMASQGDFAKYLSAAPVGADVVLGELGLDTNGWSSRAGFKPANFISRTCTLNEALRRAYRLT